ncbi:MAG: hypothetical protein ACERKV_08450 [Clostridiaceae bacterium]
MLNQINIILKCDNDIWSVPDEFLVSIDKNGKFIFLKQGEVTVYVNTLDGE